MKKLVLALAATAALTGQAFAADMPMKAARPMAAPVPVANWTGCYIAGSVGYGLFDNETSGRVRNPVTGAVTVATADQDLGGRGWLGGGGGGCDYQFGLGSGGGIFGTGQFVIGVLADYYWSDMRGTRQSILSAAYSGQEKVNSQWAVGGRIGWLMSPNLLTYFSGGYTEAHLTGVGNYFSPVVGAPNPLGASLDGRTVQGWFLGSGVEYQSGWIPNLTWKTEYRFSEYERVDRFDRFTGGGALAGVPGALTNTFNSDKLFVQTVMTSLVYRFNFGGPAVVAKY